MSTCCRKKAVLVAVYVETPRQRRLSSNHYHHHHHRHHLHLHRPKHGASRGGGYNRKAQLLDYSRRLRESAQSESSSPLIQNSAPSHHHQQHHPMNQIISVPSMKRNDSKHASLPSCLGNLKFSFLTFIRSSSTKKERKRNKPRDTVSASTKVKAIMKNFQAQKRSGFFSKFMSAFQKRR